jgi:alkanesulfonate monooxygenase SsuD/methylene tetrahydromethanopterin reductase-like flavin-dependent oxidoreductase (luciferase family)
VLPGIGHGVQEWMGQIGARQRSPMTALDEVVTALKRLLAGETVTTDGTFVRLRDVALAAPPSQVPPVLVGVQGKKSMGVAGRVADGLILAEPATPADVRAGLTAAGRSTDAGDFALVTFSMLCVHPDRTEARRQMAPWLAGLLDQHRPALADWPFIGDLRALYAKAGADGLVGMPDDWWRQVGPIGTVDDAVAHVDELRRAGATAVAFFPTADVDIARRQIDDVLAIVAASAH